MLSVAALTAFDEVNGQLRDAIVSARCVSLFDDDVSALNVAKRAQSASEGIEFLFIRSRCSEKSNSGELCWLLRPRRKRPRRRSTAEKRDEVAAFQLIEWHSAPASQGQIARYRIDHSQSADILNLVNRWPVPPKHHQG
jgi:hypothetical protein